MAKTRGSHPRGVAGIAILGVLIALGIVLYLYFGPTGSGGKSYMDQVVETKKQGESLNLSTQAYGLAQAIVAHKLSSGSDEDPSSFEEIGLSGSSYVDPWGNTMTFRIEGNPRQVVLISSGPDGTPGNEDDVKGSAPLQM